MCKADVRKGLGDGLAMRLTLSKPREIDKSSVETDNRSSISSELNFEIDLPGKRYRSTIYRLNLIKLYRRKPELANLVIENSSEGIVKDSEILYLGILSESQLYFKLPPDRINYLGMINTKTKEGFPPNPGTIVLRKERRGIVGHCTGFVEMILRWLEQIDVSRIVDIDILMQIWKNRVEQIDLVLKWLSRVGSEVRPTKGESEPCESLLRVHNVYLA
ncbi:UNVERIFIED_CONTAM: hypothetical protein NCL1_53909 [Trichonephila clavipes]